MSQSKDIQTSKFMQTLAAMINSALTSAVGQRMGFMLIVFQSEDDGRSNYISNCDRSEAIKAMEFLLQRWKEGMPDTPAHEIH